MSTNLVETQKIGGNFGSSFRQQKDASPMRNQRPSNIISPPRNRENYSVIQSDDFNSAGGSPHGQYSSQKSHLGYDAKVNSSGTMSNHYEVPNLSSMLYEFTLKEADHVKQSFRIGNFNSIRDLPKHLMPGNVSFSSKSKIEENLYQPREERTYIELTNGGGFFSKFEWKEDNFENYIESERLNRQENVKKINSVHGEATFVTNPKREATHKHQNQFNSSVWGVGNENNAIGYLSENDPYEANAFEVLRAKWIGDSKKLYGDFIQAQGTKSLDGVNRSHLPEMVGYIKRRLLTDWNKIDFIIGTNPEDYIELRFTASSVDAPSGLKAYMSTLVDSDPHMGKFKLRRIAQYWGLRSNMENGSGRGVSEEDIYGNEDDQEDSFVYYMVAPHWAKQKNPVLYLKQFPH